MKKTTFASLCALCLGTLSCSPESEEIQNGNVHVGVSTNQSYADTTVTISFAPQFEVQPMTRAAITEAATRLDVWVYEDDEEVADVHQSSTDTGFGTVSLTLNKTKTYTLYAVAHKATDACTLTDGIIAYPDDKVKESFFYTTTFSPATATTLNCAMHRITGKFTLQTTDAVQADVDHFRFIVSQTGTRFDVATSSPTNIIDRTVDFATISRKQSDGTTSFAFQVLSTTDSSTSFDITATAYDSSDNIIEEKTFTDVPIRNGYRTQYTGAFFVTSPFTMTFTASDWNDFDTVNF